MALARFSHTATLLPNGKVLVAGGDGNNGPLASTETYDPATEKWDAAGSLGTSHWWHTATMLSSGKVLVVGGVSNSTFNETAIAELYDAGLGSINSKPPQMTIAASSFNLGSGLVITGGQFRGVSEGSSGNNHSSSTDYPLVQLRSIESGQATFLLSSNWSTNSFTSVPVWNFPPGYALVTVFVNGIPSTSSVVNIGVPVPTAATLTDAKKLTNGSFQFDFTNSVGALFGAVATTNLSLPLTNWTSLGGVAEISPGQFQFTDPEATNSPQRFYLIRAP
jgi:Galactose oxidase, central domain